MVEARRPLLLLCLAFSLELWGAFNQRARGGETRPYLEYEPAKARLGGWLFERTFPGPPNYESIESGDRPERQWLLWLEQPISVKAKPGEELNFTVEDAREITLVILDQKNYRRWRHLLGMRVVAAGGLFCGMTAHYRTDVAMTVSRLRPALEPKE